MAKIKYSALVSDMRNSLNGSTLSKNRYGSYVRNKVTPVNPQTSFQQAARQILGNLSSSFRGLTGAQIKAWNSAGADFPFTDIFGDTKHLSGQTLFVKLNANLEKVGMPRISNPPSAVGFPQIDIDGLNASATGGDLDTLEFELIPGQIPANFALVVYATPSTGRAISFVKNRFRYVGVASADANGLVSIADQYKARFGNVIGGQVIHVKVALVSLSTGQQGVPLTLSTTLPLEGAETIVSGTLESDMPLEMIFAFSIASGGSVVPEGYEIRTVYSNPLDDCSTIAVPVPHQGVVLEAGEPLEAINNLTTNYAGKSVVVRADLFNLADGTSTSTIRQCNTAD